MKKNSKFIDNYKADTSIKELFVKQRELSLKHGLQPITPPSPDILFDPSGEEARRRSYQFFQRAGLTSGRYLEEKNNKYLDNYIKALNKYPDKDFWADTIERLKELKANKNIMHSGDFLGDILPPMNDWYPSSKGLKRGKGSLPYKGMVDIDLASTNLNADLNEAMDILGVNKVRK